MTFCLNIYKNKFATRRIQDLRPWRQLYADVCGANDAYLDLVILEHFSVPVASILRTNSSQESEGKGKQMTPNS